MIYSYIPDPRERTMFNFGFNFFKMPYTIWGIINHYQQFVCKFVCIHYIMHIPAYNNGIKTICAHEI